MENANLTPPARTWILRFPRGRILELGRRPRVMGILNLTPDSFSDGGLWNEPERAVERALALLADGADMLDLGAESTRPGGGVYGEGAQTVSPQEEADRLLPVLEALRATTDELISVDTRKGSVARQALAAGADLINDVSALADPDLGQAVAEAGCPIVLMHSRGEIATMQKGIRFKNLLGEVRDELSQAADRAVAAGIDRSKLILDPGIGFGKTEAQNLTLLARLDELTTLDRPILVGASRKSFISSMLPPNRRLGGSLAAAAWAAAQGAALLRVHDVAETLQLIDICYAIARHSRRGDA